MSPKESRAALKLLTGQAAATSLELLRSTSGSPESRRTALLDGGEDLVGYYSEGSAALAADFYEDQREAAGAAGVYRVELVVADRTVKLRRALAWAADPLFQGDELLAGDRLAGVIQLDTARPFRDTILTNQQKDPQSVGWRRITSGGCKLCRMLADRGAVYKESTAQFAAHPNCNCSAQPVFVGGDVGEEASGFQYLGSRRNRTPESRRRLREYLDSFY
ncbi:hypothetical protein EDF22_0644 [Rathayibacter sp. PhB127]|uniref:VG15 protein n=1 Tax=Rathayibacter sp. PhB127 TaxID=2485176 RepID=UPI000F4B8DCB|nr:hypothetical protein [Rathayibacter sp. PhB127]ROS28912.1 hypothetical protein EDF22_0644 [Rathayibacter sp. PhB127]